MTIKVEEATKKELIVQDGLELLEINIKYPLVCEEGDEKPGKKNKKKAKNHKGIATINACLEDIAKRCFEYAKGALLSSVVRAYEENDHPRKRFTHRRCIYTSAYKVTYQDERYLSLVTDIQLLNSGKKLRFKRLGQTFDLRTGGVCPIFLFIDPDKNAKKSIREKNAGFYLRGEDVVLFTNPSGAKRYQEYSLKKTTESQNKRESGT